MRLRLVLLERRHESIYDLTSVDHSELSEEKAELLLIRFGQAAFHVRRQIPESLLERTKCFLPRLVEELLVSVRRLALVLRVLSQPLVNLVAQIIVDVVVQHCLEVGREMDLGRVRTREVVKRAVWQ